jgi:hypothetical protein
MNLKPCPFCGSDWEIENEIEAFIISHPSTACVLIIAENFIYEKDIYTEQDIELEFNKRMEK